MGSDARPLAKPLQVRVPIRLSTELFSSPILLKPGSKQERFDLVEVHPRSAPLQVVEKRLPSPPVGMTNRQAATAGEIDQDAPHIQQRGTKPGHYL